MTAESPLSSAIVGVLVGLVGITLAVWWPGLSGPFFLDDYALLPLLEHIDPRQPWPGIWAFLTDTSAGPFGRPVSMLALLVNGQTWPTLPWLYKFTNLLLHVTVGLLLFALVRQVAREHYGNEDLANRTALLVAAFWLLHPMQGSTVLYVVQRMSQLSALFVVLGLLCYLRGRQRLRQGAPWPYAWMTAAVLLCMPLAALSKETGVLLAPLILVLEYSLFAGAAREDRPSTAWMGVFLWLPTLMLGALLIYFSLGNAYEGRAFSLAQRLLTEARVVGEYLWRWFYPPAGSRGVFVDGYELSSGLTQPIATLPAVITLAFLMALAILHRRRAPLLALAVFFFFVGHVLESTSLPLELYFEHRNYLPSMLLVLPVAGWLAQRGEGRPALWVTLMTCFGLLAAGAYRTAGIWGEETALARYSLDANPRSTRAIGNWAGLLARQGHHDQALAVLEDGLRRLPEATDLGLLLLSFKCRSGGVTEADLGRMRQQLMRRPLPLNAYPLLGGVVERVPKRCQGMSIAQLMALLADMELVATRQQEHEALRRLHHYQGILRLKAGDPAGALARFSATQKILPDLALGLTQVSLFIRFRHYPQAAAWLDELEQTQLSGRTHLGPSAGADMARIRTLRSRIQAAADAMPSRRGHD